MIKFIEDSPSVKDVIEYKSKLKSTISSNFSKYSSPKRKRQSLTDKDLPENCFDDALNLSSSVSFDDDDDLHFQSIASNGHLLPDAHVDVANKIKNGNSAAIKQSIAYVDRNNGEGVAFRWNHKRNGCDNMHGSSQVPSDILSDIESDCDHEYPEELGFDQSVSVVEPMSTLTIKKSKSTSNPHPYRSTAAVSLQNEINKSIPPSISHPPRFEIEEELGYESGSITLHPHHDHPLLPPLPLEDDFPVYGLDLGTPLSQVDSPVLLDCEDNMYFGYNYDLDERLLDGEERGGAAGSPLSNNFRTDKKEAKPNSNTNADNSIAKQGSREQSPPKQRPRYSSVSKPLPPSSHVAGGSAYFPSISNPLPSPLSSVLGGSNSPVPLLGEADLSFCTGETSLASVSFDDCPSDDKRSNNTQHIRPIPPPSSPPGQICPPTPSRTPSRTPTWTLPPSPQCLSLAPPLDLSLHLWRNRSSSSVAAPPPLTKQSSLGDTKLLLWDSDSEGAAGEEGETSTVVRFSRDFFNIGLVGSGTFADVFKVKLTVHMSTNSSATDNKEVENIFAVKKSRLQFRSKRDRESLLGEVVLMKRLGRKCRHVVRFHRAWQEDSFFHVQLEFCDKGCLRDLIADTSKAGGTIPDETVWHVVHDVASGLQHIHSKGMVHLDIKPANLLIGGGGLIKIADFGMAAMIGRQQDEKEGDTR